MIPFMAPMMMGQAAGGAAFVQTVFNPADSPGGLTFTDGNRTATLNASAYVGVRAVKSRISGKYFFKGTYSSLSGNTTGVGLSNYNASLGGYLGQSADSVSYFADGRIFTNNSTSASAQAYNAGDTIGVACNCAAGKVWFSRNGVWQNGDPAAGTGGATWANSPVAGYDAYPTFTPVGQNSFTLAADATGAPSGFLPWG